MAVNVGATNAGLSRINNFLNPNTNWTRMFWIRNGTSTPTVGQFRTYWVFGDNSFATPYFWIGNPSPYANNLVILEVYDGVTFLDSSSFNLGNSAWHHIAVSYNSTTHDFKFYVDSVLISTINLNINAVVFGTDEDLLTDTVGSWSDVACGFERTWQRTLTLAQIQTEYQSSRAQLLTDLLTDSRLGAPDELTDSANGHDWTATDPANDNYVLGPLTTQVKFGIGCSVRGSQVYTGALALPFFSVDGVTSSGSPICSLAYIAGSVSGTAPPNALYVLGTSSLRLIYRGSNVNVTQDINNPWTDPMSGQIRGAEPFVSTWSWHQISVLGQTSTYDRGLAFSHTNAFQQDGSISVFVDLVSAFSASSIFIKASNYNLPTGVLTPQIQVSHSPSGVEAASFWLTSNNVMPTFSGINQIPSSASLVNSSLWALGAYNPPWALGSYFGVGPIFNPTAGLDGGYGIDTFLYDTAIRPSGGNTVTGTPGSLNASAGSLGYVVATFTLSALSSSSITVIKTVNGTDKSFAFTTVGLSPGSFNLSDGDNQLFSAVTPGSGYSIVETPDADYITTYSVSNGSPNTNIVVGVNEAVTVTVTNLQKGGIIVGKMTSPNDASHVFNFLSPGLSPVSFSLLSDESRLFSGLDPTLTYAINEVADANWTPTYLFDDGVSTKDSIIVEPGQIVTVGVLNTLRAAFSGLYKLIPNKRSDCFIDQDGLESCVRVPWFVETAELPTEE